MAPDRNTVESLQNQLVTGNGVEVRVLPEGGSEVVIKTTDETAQRVDSELKAEKNGIPLAQYFKSHANLVATKEEVDAYIEREAARGRRCPEPAEKLAAANFVDDGKGMVIYYFDNQRNLKFIQLPFEKITEFKKVADILDGNVNGGDILNILTSAGFVGIDYERYRTYKDIAEDVAAHKEKSSTPQIEF